MELLLSHKTNRSLLVLVDSQLPSASIDQQKSGSQCSCPYDYCIYEEREIAILVNQMSSETLIEVEYCVEHIKQIS